MVVVRLSPSIHLLDVRQVPQIAPDHFMLGEAHARGILFDGDLIPTAPLQMLICCWRPMGSRAELRGGGRAGR